MKEISINIKEYKLNADQMENFISEYYGVLIPSSKLDMINFEFQSDKHCKECEEMLERTFLIQIKK